MILSPADPGDGHLLKPQPPSPVCFPTWPRGTVPGVWGTVSSPALPALRAVKTADAQPSPRPPCRSLRFHPRPLPCTAAPLGLCSSLTWDWFCPTGLRAVTWALPPWGPLSSRPGQLPLNSQDSPMDPFSRLLESCSDPHPAWLGACLCVPTVLV